MYQDITLIFTAHVSPSAEVNSKVHKSHNHITSLLMSSRRGLDKCSERNSFVHYNTHILSLTGALHYQSSFCKTREQAVASSTEGPLCCWVPSLLQSWSSYRSFGISRSSISCDFFCCLIFFPIRVNTVPWINLGLLLNDLWKEWEDNGHLIWVSDLNAEVLGVFSGCSFFHKF